MFAGKRNRLIFMGVGLLVLGTLLFWVSIPRRQVVNLSTTSLVRNGGQLYAVVRITNEGPSTIRYALNRSSKPHFDFRLASSGAFLSRDRPRVMCGLDLLLRTYVELDAGQFKDVTVDVPYFGEDYEILFWFEIFGTRERFREELPRWLRSRNGESRFDCTASLVTKEFIDKKDRFAAAKRSLVNLSGPGERGAEKIWNNLRGELVTDNPESIQAWVDLQVAVYESDCAQPVRRRAIQELDRYPAYAAKHLDRLRKKMAQLEPKTLKLVEALIARLEV